MGLHPYQGKIFTLASLLATAICLPACSDRPSDAQIEAWRQAAIIRNAELAAADVQDSLSREWKLVIQGQTTTDKSVVLNWQQLQALATTEVTTTDPNHVVNAQAKFTFRGVRVATLLKQFGVEADVKEVTFVCFDGYHVTVSRQDLINYPIILAIARNNQPISRAQGGPIYLVFPYLQYPELKEKYNDLAWGFYVSNMVIGTQTAKLRVGKREVDLASLDQLPQVTLTQPVRYRLGWQGGSVKLHGVRVRDVLNLAGVQVPPNGLVVRGTAPIDQDPKNPVRLSGEDIRNCDLILATRWSSNQQFIPARMGGPLTLAYGTKCAVATTSQRWMTFVEELAVAP